MEQFKQISHSSDIMGGKACIRGTRVTVGMIMTLFSEGKSVDDILDDYPYLTKADVAEALKYAAWTVSAREAVIVSVEADIIQGRTATTIAPQETSTRAEIAMIFKRYIEDFLGKVD